MNILFLLILFILQILILDFITFITLNKIGLQLDICDTLTAIMQKKNVWVIHIKSLNIKYKK